jgi:aspartyl-tRNA(Asn)/glutamyl-tRNA(Gln) amidotransferase subunit A
VDIIEAARLLRRREVSSTELVRDEFARADAVDQVTGAYLHRMTEPALRAARRADADLAAGRDRGPLHGIPLAVKDNMFTADGPTTAQSRVHDPSWDDAPDATVVARLRAHGAVITGKLTLSEFAIGQQSPDSPFPRPRNPWNPRCWPGGSSSGTGVAVAAGMVFAGLGTDTAGSIRIPSAMCGITGLKPTFGRVPVTGAIPLAPSLDHVGPMARSARDCALLLQAIAGHDPSDPASSTAPVPDCGAGGPRLPRPFRVGVAMPFTSGLDPAAAAFDDALAVLGSLGARLTDVTLPDYEPATAAAKIILEAESFAYHKTTLRTRWRDYAPMTRQRLATGAFTSVADLDRARRQREQTIASLGELLRTVHVIVSPAMPIPAPALDRHGSPDRAVIFTAARPMRYWSLSGYPALVVPMGFSPAGLPVSLQIVGSPFEEPTVLAVGVAFQAATDWHRAEPALNITHTSDGAAGTGVLDGAAGTGALPAGPPPASAAAAAAAEALTRHGITGVEDDIAALAAAYTAHLGDVETLRQGAASRQR